MALILKYSGILTAGYYNDMEAGSPVFIDGDSLSDVVKALLHEKGFDDNFCFGPFGDASNVGNALVGKKVNLIIEIGE